MASGTYDIYSKNFDRHHCQNNYKYQSFKNEEEPYFGPARDAYVYGFDFKEIPVNGLIINNTLVGKFDFSKAFLRKFKAHRSIFLECNFQQAKIKDSGVYGDGPKTSRFIGSDFEKAIIQNSFIGETDFIKCNFKETTIKGNIFASTTFEICELDEAALIGNIFLKTKFLTSSGRDLTVSGIFVDEYTMQSLLKCRIIDKTKVKIEEIDVDSIDIDNTKYTMEQLKSLPPESQLRGKWQYLRSMLSSQDQEKIKRHIEKNRMFIINRVVWADLCDTQPTSEDTRSDIVDKK